MSKAFKDHFSAQAPDYARYRPDYPAELFAWLAGRLEPLWPRSDERRPVRWPLHLRAGRAEH